MPPPTQFFNRLRHRLAAVETARQTDAVLLDAFIREQQPEAFAALVQRHGVMVLGVCRRILGNHHDAEDAFQATFLVLARKAATVRPGNRLVSWLYGVALRTAMKARRMEMRRKERQQAVAQPPAHLAPEPMDELHAILDEELERLPEHYRLPILLCELQGQTRKQAAESLGWTEGKLAGRLTRGRALLARRLQKRGVTIPVVGLFSVLPTIAEAVPSHLLDQTVHIATLSILGEASSAVSSTVLSLTQGVMKAMFLSKLKVLTTVALAGVLLITGLSVGGWSMVWSGEPIPNRPAASGSRSEATPPKPPADIELIDIHLVQEKEVQNKLRLTRNQVQRIQEGAEKYAAANPQQVEQINQFKKQIEELHAKIVEIDRELSKVQRTKEVGEIKAMKQVASQVLSQHAMTELRKISLQRRSLHEVLNDPRIQEYLQINDEQRKKLHEVNNNSFSYDLGISKGVRFLANDRIDLSATSADLEFTPVVPWLYEARAPQDRVDARANIWLRTMLDIDRGNPAELLKILTPTQTQRLRELMGTLPGDKVAPPPEKK